MVGETGHDQPRPRRLGLIGAQGPEIFVPRQSGVILPSEAAQCPDCWAHAASHPHLIGACASVGIEHGKSTAEMVRDYLAAYHERGHRERHGES